MIGLCLVLLAAAFSVAVPATLLVRRLSTRAGALDGPGVAGQVKAAARRVPNTGGIGIVAGLVLPIAAGLLILHTDAGAQFAARLVPQVGVYLDGLREQTAPAAGLIGCVIVLHIIGLIDDRRPLGPYSKLVIMLGIAAAACVLTHSRLLTLLDARVGGPWLSITITVLWIGVVTNAFNFLDNMDGLSGGVALICAVFFFVTALISQPAQWFIAATLATLMGSLAGFLLFNFPFRERDSAGRAGASIFMGDGGSLVIGFLLALLSVRITYVHPAVAPGASGAAMGAASPWYAIFIPLIILAIPLYDFCSVTLIRMSQGRSPFVGDLQHFSHRLVQHGLSRRDAVLVIYGATCVTGIGAVMLPQLEPWQAALVGVQTLMVLLLIALYEWSRGSGGARGSGKASHG